MNKDQHFDDQRETTLEAPRQMGEKDPKNAEHTWYILTTLEEQFRPKIDLPDSKGLYLPTTRGSRKHNVRKLRNGKRVNDWWDTVSKILKMASEDPNFQVPPALLACLADISGQAAHGLQPLEIKASLKRGRPKNPVMRYARAVAGYYIIAARNGKIDDPKPVSTIEEIYGLSNKKAAQKWATDTQLLEEFTVLGALTPHSLALETANCGMQYRFYGNSTKAIERRDERQFERKDKSKDQEPQGDAP